MLKSPVLKLRREGKKEASYFHQLCLHHLQCKEQGKSALHRPLDAGTDFFASNGAKESILHQKSAVLTE